ncbi:WxL domain-containing protein [Enterococcus sp. DIV0187]|uniref:WxL domain-containing protein n=1 Tax=Enterococcus sp. DIV0187 TaxID=2774644 RepID=UPI003F28BE57
MKKPMKKVILVSLLMALLITIFPINHRTYANEIGEATTEEKKESSKETLSPSESLEEPDTTESSGKKETTKASGEKEKIVKEKKEDEDIKITPFAAGQPLRPEHMYISNYNVSFRIQYPTGAPVENLDVVLELKDSSVGGGPMLRWDIHLVYNSVSQLYEGVMNYPYQFPLSYPSGYSNVAVGCNIRIKNLGLATSITENYTNSFFGGTRYSGYWGGNSYPARDPDTSVVIGPIAGNPVNLYKQADQSWLGVVNHAGTASYHTTTGEPVSMTFYVPANPYSHTVNYNYITEYIVNEKGDTITAPSGFWNYRQWYINTPTTLYEFGRTNVVGPKETDVPMKYVAGGITYNYEGWYTGWKKPTTLNTAHPITVPVKQNEGFPVTVVYSSHVLKTEKYYNNSGGSLESGIHDTASQEVPLDSTFTGNPQNVIKASNGDYYVYQGWLKDTEMPGANTPRAGKPNEKMTQNTDFKYIYKKSTPARSITMTPDTKLIDSGDLVTWTAKVKNTSADPINLDDNEMRLLAVPDYVAGSTVVDGTPQPDSFWTGNSIPTIGPSGEVTIQFKTQHVGLPNSYHGTVISVKSAKVSQDMARGNVRIKDKDSKPIPPGVDIGLENIPNKFTFEDVVVNNFSQTASLNMSSYASHTISDGLFVRLFDERSSIPGWKLTAKLDTFRQTSHPSRTLSSAVTMDFKTNLEKVNNPKTATESIDPSPSGSIPTINSNVHLVSNNTDVLVMHSPVGIGDGTWQARIPLNNVKLTLPANSGVAGKTYESALTWTLTDAP